MKDFTYIYNSDETQEFDILDAILCENDINLTGKVKLDIEEINQRIRSLMTVKDKCLSKFRDECIKKMNKMIGYYNERGDIPSNLDESFQILKGKLDNTEIEKIKNGSESDMAQYHFSLGLWIRNNWRLGIGKSRIAKYFNDQGVFEPDCISGLILDCFWCYLNNKDLNLEERIEKCQGDELKS